MGRGEGGRSNPIKHTGRGTGRNGEGRRETDEERGREGGRREGEAGEGRSKGREEKGGWRVK